MPVTKKNKKRVQMNWAPTTDDFRLMAELRAVLGVNDSAILRLSIRALAEQKGIPLTR